MIFYRTLVLLLAVMLSSIYCSAQENEYVYQDTAMMHTDSIEARAVELREDKQQESDEEDTLVADTILRNNGLFINYKAIQALKNTSSFEYYKNLDSLLKEQQKKLQQENVPVKHESSWLVSFFSSQIISYFFYTLAVFFIGVILYKLFLTEGFFQRNYTKSNVTDIEDKLTQNLAHQDFETLIIQAVAKEDFRLAVRYHYMQLLQKLSSKNIIQFSVDKTNYEYIEELTGKSFKKSYLFIAFKEHLLF